MNLSTISARSISIISLLIGVGLLSSGVVAPAAHAARKTSDQTNQSADLSVAISDTPDPALLLDEITYSVRVYNAGPGSSSAWLNAQLDGAGFISVSSSQGSCTANGYFYCSLGSLAARTSALVTVRVRPGRVGSISLGASAATDISDPDSSNNAKTEYTYVWAAPSEAGCGGALVGGGSCKFLATGGRVTATAVYLANQFVLVCNWHYCPLLSWSSEEYAVGVRLTDPLGRVMADCLSGGYCTTTSAEVIPAGTVLTCSAYDTSRYFGVGAYACTA